MFPFDSTLATISTFLCTVGLGYIFFPALAAAYTRDEFRSVTPHVLQAASSKRPLLSLVVPAYNEQYRLPVMMDAAFKYLVQKDCRALLDLKKYANESTALVEWIVVDDGSTDDTVKILDAYVKKSPKNEMNWLLLSLPTNSGKGAAVQAGMLASHGMYALMVDADGATEFGPGLELLIKRLRETNAPIVLGSRAQALTNNRSRLRNLLMHLFHWCVVVLVSSGADTIRDTQCGFKLFSSETIPLLFERLHLRRWAFDTEVIFLASRLKLRMEEVMVPWQEIDGSKLHTSTFNLGIVAFGMLRDMICVSLCYTLGIWQLPQR